MQSVADLEALPPSERVGVSLHIAAQLLETAAYEMARDQHADDVSEVILMAARLDLLAKRQDAPSTSGKIAQIIRRI